MPKTGISPKTRERAKRLRREPTEAEKAVWRVLRELNRVRPCRFRRQAPIGPYVADFACFTNKLEIEIDGSQHAESARDLRRDAWLGAQGFRTLRFWNSDVRTNLSGVAETIDAAVNRFTPAVSDTRGETA